MRLEDVNRIRRQLDEELESGIRLLRDAYAQKARALEVLAFGAEQSAGEDRGATKGGSSIRSRRSPSSGSANLPEAVAEAAEKLEGPITNAGVRAWLEMNRPLIDLSGTRNSAITQALKRLVERGALIEVEKGRGKAPSRFERSRPGVNPNGGDP